MSDTDEEPYILFKGNTPNVVSPRGLAKTLSRDVITAYGYWAGYTLEMLSSGSAPFIRYKIKDSAKVSYHYTAYSLAPFFVLADVVDSELLFGIRAMRGSALSADNYLSQWFYDWPWSGCRLVKPQDPEVTVTKMVLLSISPFVEIIVDVPKYVMDALIRYGENYVEPEKQKNGSVFELLEV